MKKILLLFVSLLLVSVTTSAENTMVQFTFASASDESGTYTGTLHSGAQLRSYGDTHVLDLGTANGYFQLDEALGSFVNSFAGPFTIAVNLYVPADADLTADGNYVWYFSNSPTTGYMYYRATTNNRFAISATDESEENFIENTTSALQKGKWNSIIYVQYSATRGYLYINGKSVNKIQKILPNSLNSLIKNYLGRGGSDMDAYLRGAMLNDFRIYNYRLVAVSTLAESTTRLNAIADSLALRKRMEDYSPGNLTNLKEDVTLPARDAGLYLTWETSDPNVITSSGHITRPASGKPVATARLNLHISTYFNFQELTHDKYFDVTVLPDVSDEEAVAYDAENLPLKAHLNNVYSDVALPTVGTEGSVIFWKSSDPEYMTDEGRVLKQPEGSKHHLTLTATIMKGSAKEVRNFDVYIHERENYENYLFVYFPSNADENLYYAISKDGYNYTPINRGNAFLKADTTTIMGGLRDPHILRGEDGNFYMAVTDMMSSKGWDSNRGIVLMKSPDLIHWSHSTVHFPTRFEGTTFAHVDRVWAPETIYDPDAGKYMVYFSIRTTDGTASYDKDYYCYANEDFTDLEGLPEYFYDRGDATIDMDIVYNESDGLYHGFYKTEGQGGICKVTATRLTPEPGQPAGSQWKNPSGTLQQTTERVEGAGVFKLINQDNWVLMYDCYDNKHYQFCSSTDLSTFTFVQNTATTGAFTPRHGTVIAITAEETEALLKVLPIGGTQTAKIEGFRSERIKQAGVTINSTNVFLPVDRNTDLTAFDPQPYGNVGTVISPTGPQNFTSGPVTYTLTNGSAQSSWLVSVSAEGNPVLPDFHADPEVLFSNKTGRFYVYPTTDGYEGWGGYSFDVFSSANLVDFTNEGTILNLQSGKDVAWSTGNAWAPCIEEKWMNDKWRYFFYFSGNNKNLNKKTLGVAFSDSPTGPFKALATPIFTESQVNQMIDSDVFTDPVSGQTYFYYGNGNLCYRLLGDDMVSVVGSEYLITPNSGGGTNDDYRYREGTYVFYRNGIYYFLWSVDDTGSTNYHVAYGTSTSPTGPIHVASQPIVIIQDPDNYIYGTGHNSVVNVPGTDDWYIVYHRINRNYLSNGPGYHREVCIDKMTFDADGKIQRVTPTREGIEPVRIENVEELINGVQLTEVSDGKAALRVDYYTIDGKSLGGNAPTGRGIYIRRELLSNGRVRSMKIVR